jgi:hypothetical protein
MNDSTTTDGVVLRHLTIEELDRFHLTDIDVQSTIKVKHSSDCEVLHTHARDHAAKLLEIEREKTLMVCCSDGYGIFKLCFRSFFNVRFVTFNWSPTCNRWLQ